MNAYSRLPRPAVVAHRGASAHAPENTLAAFRLAASQGADAIELDARLSADGQVVVFHDDTLQRTTNGRGRVSDQPLAALQALDAGSWCDAAYAGERIPTLAEVLDTLGQTLVLNIELKESPARRAALAAAVADLVGARRLTGQVLFSSFDWRALAALHRALPGASLGLLAAPGPLGFWARRAQPGRLPYAALHPAQRDVSPALIQRARRRGWRVLAYTVNHPADFQRLHTLGVDGYFTDDPALALRLRAEAPR